MSAKSDLLSRLQYLSSAVTEQAVIDEGISPSIHNGVANLLRKGLGIVAFNILEDYIKKRTEEGLHFLSHSGLTFGHLTNALKKSSTVGALKSLMFNINILKKEPDFDVIDFIQTEAYNIFSTKNHPFQLSKYSLVYSGSNVYADDILDLMKAFGINNCWQKLKFISDSIYGGIPDLLSSFKNASERRHSAAHDVNFNYDHSWLSNIQSEILALAAALDIALAAKCRQVSRNPSQPIDSIDISVELNFRFLETSPSSAIREIRGIGSRTIKNWQTVHDAVAHLSPLLARRKEFLVVLGSSGRVVDWHT